MDIRIIIICILTGSIIAIILKNYRKLLMGLIPLAIYLFNNFVMLIPPLFDLLPFGAILTFILMLMCTHLTEIAIGIFLIFSILLIIRAVEKFREYD